MARALFTRRLRALVAGTICLAAMPTVALAQFSVTPNLTVGCDWFLAFDPADPSIGNSAYPEMNARYWVSVVSDTVPAGSRLRVEGRFPHARYSSLQVYDGNLFALDTGSDYHAVPDPGSANPYLDQTRRDPSIPPGGSYTAFVRINTPLPPIRELNTLYRRPSAAFEPKARKRTLVVYRIYLPEGGNEGSVGLPRLVLERPGLAEVALANTPDVVGCAQLRLAATLPRSAPLSLLKPLIPQQRPVFRKFDPALLQSVGLGVGYNPQNSFIYAKTERGYAELMLIRGRLPSYTTQNPFELTPQIRFFSLCQYGSSSTKVHGCLSDRELPLDELGYYTVVISKHTQRPPELPGNYGWVTFGPENNTVVTVRELLAHPSFTKSIEQTPAELLAEREGYTPLATYCSIAVITEAIVARLSPADAYGRCAASR